MKKLIYILIILLILSLIGCIAISYNKFLMERERDYYKEQMSNMCHMSNIQQDIITMLAEKVNITEIKEVVSRGKLDCEHYDLK